MLLFFNIVKTFIGGQDNMNVLLCVSTCCGVSSKSEPISKCHCKQSARCCKVKFFIKQGIIYLQLTD